MLTVHTTHARSRARTQTHTRAHAHKHTRVRAHSHACTHAHTHTDTQTHTRAHTRTHSHTQSPHATLYATANRRSLRFETATTVSIGSRCRSVGGARSASQLSRQTDYSGAVTSVTSSHWVGPCGSRSTAAILSFSYAIIAMKHPHQRCIYYRKADYAAPAARSDSERA